MRLTTGQLLLIGIFALVLGVKVYALRTFSLDYTVDFIFDDAYYYLGVARNLAAGAGSKFAEPLRTNGYQPLWLLTLATGAFVFGLSKLGLIIYTVIVTHVVQMVALVFCFRSRDRNLHYVGYGLAAAIVVFNEVFSWGLETALLSLFVPWLYQVVQDMDEDRLPEYQLGIFFALLFLVRLDALSLFLAYGLIRLFVKRAVDGRLLRVAAMVGAVCGVYLLVNRYYFGLPVPVSGIAKSIGSRLGENWPIGASYLSSLSWPAALLVAALVLERWVLEGELSEPWRFVRQMACALLALLLCALYYCVLSGWPVWGWYLWASALLTVFCAARLFRAALLAARGAYWRRASLPARVCVVVGSVVLVAQLGRLAALDERQVAGAYLKSIPSLRDTAVMKRYLKSRDEVTGFNKMNLDLLQEFLSRQPPGTVLMGDRGGGLGYFLDAKFPFIHLEGLVASAEFATYRRAGRGEQFIEKYDPRYLVVDRERYLETDDPQLGHVFGVAEPMTGLSAHEGIMLFCFPDRAILYRQHYVLRIGHQSRFVFDYRQKIPCPPTLIAQLSALEAKYSALRKFSVPSEY